MVHVYCVPLCIGRRMVAREGGGPGLYIQVVRVWKTSYRLTLMLPGPSQ